METHRARYQGLMLKARLSEEVGLYRAAVDLALATWEHIDGMMQYERRYADKEFTSIQGIDMILKYAPLLLDFNSLNTLETLLKNYRRIEKNTSHNLADKLAKARTLMRDAYRLWDHLEHHPEARQDKLRQILGGDQDQWRSMVTAWEKMGLLRRTPESGSYRLALSTRMGKVVSAKCFSCGCVVDAPKAMFLEKQICSECRTRAMFVILSTEIPPIQRSNS